MMPIRPTTAAQKLAAGPEPPAPLPNPAVVLQRRQARPPGVPTLVPVLQVSGGKRSADDENNIISDQAERQLGGRVEDIVGEVIDPAALALAQRQLGGRLETLTTLMGHELNDESPSNVNSFRAAHGKCTASAGTSLWHGTRTTSAVWCGAAVQRPKAEPNLQLVWRGRYLNSTSLVLASASTCALNDPGDRTPISKKSKSAPDHDAAWGVKSRRATCS